MEYERLTGTEKAAVLTLALPEEAARALLGRLGEDEVERILAAAAHLDEVPAPVLERVLAEFRESLSCRRHVVLGGRARAGALARSSLAEATGIALSQRIGRDDARIDRRLARFSPGFVARTLAPEHPQTTALVLSQLPPERAAFVIAALPPEVAADVVLRLASLDDVPRAVIAELEEAIAEIFDGGSGPPSPVGGVEVAARLMAKVPRSAAHAVLDGAEAANPILVEEIRRRMFRFDDLQRLDRRGFQLLLQEVPIEDLVLALKNASEAMCAKVFENVSMRAAEQVREEMDLLGVVRTSEIEAVQARILDTARRLEEEGRLDLGGEGTDDADF